MVKRALGGRKDIWLIDHRKYRRNFCRLALEKEGFAITESDQYLYPPPGVRLDSKPALVVLGCTTVGPEERDLVGRIVKLHHSLLVLPTVVAPDVMRSLFRAGAQDVTEMPGAGDQLVQLVDGAIARDAAATSYRSVLDGI